MGIPKRSILVVWMAVGIAPAAFGQRDSVEVMLGGKAVRIREVTVKAPPIGKYGDTLTYRVDNFADIQDRTIGDVLRKMPGIEVTEGGEIKYQGEPINRFYVEGSDLLGGRYGLATNNISHRDVRSVELMENHQPVRALKDIVHSEHAALNLRLREEARARWVGTAELGAGTGATPLSGTGALFGMRIGRGWQSMQNLRVQNTGQNPAAENRSFSLADILNGGGDGPLVPDRVETGGGGAPIDERRTRFNRSALLNTTNTRKLGGDYELNLRLNYAGDRVTGESAGRVTHYLAEGENSVVEREATLARRHDISGVARLEGNREKFFLKNELSTDWSWDDRRVSLTGTYPNIQRAELPSGGGANDFELVRRVGRRTLTVNSHNRYSVKPHDLTVTEEGRVSGQSVREGAFLSHSDVSCGWGAGRWLLDARAGVSFRAQSLRSSFVGDLTQELSEFPPVAASSLGTLRGYLAPTVTYRSSHLRGSLSAPLNIYRYRFSQSGASRTDARFVSAPNLSLRWSASARWTLTGTASAGARPIDESLIHGGTIRRDYRNFTTGLVDFTGDEAAAIAGRFEYKNPIRTLFVNGSIARSWSRTPRLADRRFAGEYILTGYTAEAGLGRNWTARTGVSKGIDGARGTVELEALWSRTVGETAQNGVPIGYVSELFSLSSRFKGRLTRWCNAEYALSLRRARMSWRGERSSTDNATQRLSVHLLLTTRFFVTLSGEHYASELPDGRTQNLWPADAGATWRPSEKWEFSLELSNLFDQREYAYTVYGALSADHHAYCLRPREVLASASLRF